MEHDLEPQEALPRRIGVGDFVKYVGRGCSVLDGGPGRVISLTGTSARVEVLHACTCAGNEIRVGEKYVFALASLAQLTP